jgi:ribosome-binding factor A
VRAEHDVFFLRAAAIAAHRSRYFMEREDKSAGYRHARLEDLILEELRALLRDDVFDPALAHARITAVVLSVDYRNARVHFAVRDSRGTIPEQRSRAERALARATPFLRARLVDALELKRVPELRFSFDGVVAIEDWEDPCE